MRRIFCARRTLRQLLALIGLVAWCTPTSAAVNEWTQIGPSGGYVRGLVFHPAAAGVLYSIVEERFYVSTDNGMSWTARPKEFSDTLTALVVDPTNGDVLYVFEINSGLWRSADRGETFTFVGAGGSDAGVIDLAISHDGMRLLAATAAGALLKSDDGGAHWSNVTPAATPPLVASYFVALTIDLVNKDILYAGMLNGGVFKSTNGGATWTQLMAGPGGSLEYSIVVDPADQDHLLLSAVQLLESHDAGASWSIVGGAAGPVVAFDPQDSNRIYVGSIHNAIFRTRDGGAPWELFNTDDGLTCGWFNHLHVDPRDPSHLVGGGDEGICASSDGGSTWTSASAGISATRVETLRTAPGSQRRILVGLSPGAAYVSSDTDGSWTRLDNHSFRSGGAPSGTSIVAFDAAAPASKWLIGIRTGGLRITPDGGASWLFGDLGTPYYDLIPDAALADTFIGATHFGIVRSTNGGVNWEFTSTPADFRDFAALATDPADPAVLYAGAGGRRGAAFGVVKSTDGGHTWLAANTGIASQSINRLVVNPTNSNVIYAAASGSLSRSVDAGQSWTALPAIDQSAAAQFDDVALDPSNPDVIYAAHGTLDRSVDGGASWQTIYSGSRKRVRRVALDTLNPSIIYVGTEVHGVQAMEIALDLLLTATPPAAEVREGTTARISFEVRNQGPFSASLVSLSGTFSQAAASTTIASNRGTCSPSAGAFTCSIGALGLGEVARVTFDFTPAAGVFSVNARASAHERDPANDNNAAQVTINATSAPSAPTGGGSSSGRRGGGGTTGPLDLFALLLIAGAARWSLTATRQPRCESIPPRTAIAHRRTMCCQSW
ncbi:DUF11 domain-containing protein [Steroidobacter cummioxidans]|uniref:DUF11 domain-containing protein n=1 Tax=Steroidobacter cummioxidans TaxID=1803913 RepID=UPI0012902525|nr:DUF11 domain-containing protein [Steroidobacter cummioxidans]